MVKVLDYGPMNWDYYSGHIEAVFDLSDGSVVQYTFEIDPLLEEDDFLIMAQAGCDAIKKDIEAGHEADYIKTYAVK